MLAEKIGVGRQTRVAGTTPPAHLVPAATSRKALRPSRRQDGEDYGARATYGGDRSLVGRDCGGRTEDWGICLRGLGMNSQQMAATWSPLVIPAEAKRRAGTGRASSIDASGQNAGLNRKTGWVWQGGCKNPPPALPPFVSRLAAARRPGGEEKERLPSPISASLRRG